MVTLRDMCKVDKISKICDRMSEMLKDGLGTLGVDPPGSVVYFSTVCTLCGEEECNHLHYEDVNEKLGVGATEVTYSAYVSPGVYIDVNTGMQRVERPTNITDRKNTLLKVRKKLFEEFQYKIISPAFWSAIKLRLCMELQEFGLDAYDAKISEDGILQDSIVIEPTDRFKKDIL